jgi:hypothetical protein
MYFSKTYNYSITLPFSEQGKVIRHVRGFSDTDDSEYLRYAEGYGYSYHGSVYVDGYDMTRFGCKAYKMGNSLILVNPDSCPGIAVEITFEN